MDPGGCAVYGVVCSVIEGWKPAEGMDDRPLFVMCFVDSVPSAMSLTARACVRVCVCVCVCVIETSNRGGLGSS